MNIAKNLAQRLKTFTTRFSPTEIITIFAISAAVSALSFHLYELVRPLAITQIESPVFLTKDDFKIGETVTGNFKGVLIPNGEFTVNRRLVCETQRTALVSVRINTIKKTVLTGDKSTPIFTIEPSDTEVESEIFPDENCVVRFVNTYSKGLPLGGSRKFESRYSTEPFNIIP